MFQLSFCDRAINRALSLLPVTGERLIQARDIPVARHPDAFESTARIRRAGQKTDRPCVVEHGVWAAFIHLGHGGPVIRPDDRWTP